MARLLFKEAQGAQEIQQIHALNHRVFAEEIGQHQSCPSGLLIDRFHARNRYFIAARDGLIVGMISVHPGPEFSVTRRLPDPAILADLPRPLEVRLLAIDAKERSRCILSGLLWQIYDFAVANDYSHLLISAITQREGMYRKMGFFPLGPPVPEGAAQFIPMYMAIREQAVINRRRIGLHERKWSRESRPSAAISLMPGPVSISPAVARSFALQPVSHRSETFLDKYENARSLLKGLAGNMEVALFAGAGTLANDAVAASLKEIFDDAPGLVVSNGEFGERLANQAIRAGLKIDHLAFEWGKPWSFQAIAAAIQRGAAWIWAAHIETSTGVLNDIEELLSLAQRTNCRVALDCVSSIGAVPLPKDSEVLLLASGVSGKSLGSYAGLAFVYLSDECRQRLAGKTLCPSFDLLHIQETRGPVSTIASSSLYALACALEENYASREAINKRHRAYHQLGQRTRMGLRRAGIVPLACEEFSAPNITTFTLPWPSFPRACLEAGYQIAHESTYLKSRGWGQIATMGDISWDCLTPLLASLESSRREA